MFVRNRLALVLIGILWGASALWAQMPDDQAPGDLPPPTPWLFQIVPHYETGALAILSHLYQSGGNSTGIAGSGATSDGAIFDFIKQGGQDILFPYQRLSVDVHLGEANILTFLYQPLTLNTKTVVGRNGTKAPVVVDGVSFPSGSVLDLVYGFDFWRGSWLYNFAPGPGEILGAGLSLQVRNATISFTEVDGNSKLRAISQNIGPVPILKARYAHWFAPEFGIDLTGDGIYVASAFFNGSTKDFAGWLWDVSLSAKTSFVEGSTAFLTLRSIGGGAQGNNAYEANTATTASASSYSYNALATAALTLGFELERF
jgi:hypothetical protein